MCRITPLRLMPRSKVTSARSLRRRRRGRGSPARRCGARRTPSPATYSSRVRPARRSRCGSSRGSWKPTRRLPVVDDSEVSDSTRSGDSSAMVCAIMPPIDTPATWAARSPRWSMQRDAVRGHVAQRVGHRHPAAEEGVDEVLAGDAAVAEERRVAGVAVVVADDEEAGGGQLLAQRVRPPGEGAAEPHHQQQRVAGGVAEGLEADLDAVRRRWRPAPPRASRRGRKRPRGRRTTCEKPSQPHRARAGPRGSTRPPGPRRSRRNSLPKRPRRRYFRRMERSPLADFLVPEGFAGPRGLRALAREGSVVSEAVRYRRRVSADRATRRSVSYVERTRETGDPVLLVPGLPGRRLHPDRDEPAPASAGLPRLPLRHRGQRRLHRPQHRGPRASGRADRGPTRAQGHRRGAQPRRHDRARPGRPTSRPGLRHRHHGQPDARPGRRPRPAHRPGRPAAPPVGHGPVAADGGGLHVRLLRPDHVRGVAATAARGLPVPGRLLQARRHHRLAGLHRPGRAARPRSAPATAAWPWTRSSSTWSPRRCSRSRPVPRRCVAGPGSTRSPPPTPADPAERLDRSGRCGQPSRELVAARRVRAPPRDRDGGDLVGGRQQGAQRRRGRGRRARARGRRWPARP